MLRMIMLLMFAALSPWCQAESADNDAKDYLIYANVYQWYGELDTSQHWRELQPQAVVDLQEYPQGKWQAGAHHILNIATIDLAASAQTVAQTQVRVTVEFYLKGKDDEAVIGRYLNQVLTFEHQKIVRVHTELNELDDFESNYIASADTNLIRGFLYRWTQGLDEPGSTALNHWLAADAKIELAEAGINNINDYQVSLSEQGLVQSRRAMRNLKITPLGNAKYQLEFEYQWSALNAQGENEMANIGVLIGLTVIEGKLQIQTYKEQYLAPKTDLGAEIKC